MQPWIKTHNPLDKHEKAVMKRRKKKKMNIFMRYVKYFNGTSDLSDPVPQGIFIITGFH